MAALGATGNTTAWASPREGPSSYDWGAQLSTIGREAVAEAAVLGALAAAAYAIGTLAACPGKSSFEDVLWDILEGIFGAAILEILTQITSSDLLSITLASFSTGFLFTLVTPGACPGRAT